MSGTIITDEQQNTIMVEEENTHSTSPQAVSTDASDSSVAVLDIATYAILAIAGFLILLFVIILTGTILLFRCTKEKRRRYR